MSEGSTSSRTSASRRSSGERQSIKIPGYELGPRIGKGAMGVVHRGRQTSMDRDVAIKLLRFRASKHPKFVARFLEEARAVAQLSHPNVVAAIDAGRVGEYVYFVMELIEGETLAQHLARDGALPVDEVIEVLLGATLALEHAEMHKMVHRDVKPDNLMRSIDGRVLLCDLGLALPATAPSAGRSGRVRNATACGTPHYIAPEQARGFADIDTRADLYALGATAYHLVTGEVAFPGDDARKIMEMQCTTPVPDPREIVPELPERLCALIAHLTQKDPDARPQHPRQVRDELLAIQREITEKAEATRVARQRRRVLLGSAGVVAALGLGVFLATRSDPPPPGEKNPVAGRSAMTSTPEAGSSRRTVRGSATDPDDEAAAQARVARASRAAAAALALQSVRGRIETGELAPAEATTELKAIAETYPATPAGIEAEAEAQALMAAAGSEVTGRLNRARQQAERRLERNDYAGAQAIWTTLLKGPEAVDEEHHESIRTELDAIEARCARAWGKVAPDAVAQAESGDPSGALDLLDTFATTATPKIRALVDAARIRYQSLAAESAAKQSFATTRAAAFSAIESGDLAAAQRLLAEAEAGSPGIASTLLAQVRAAQAADAALITGLATLAPGLGFAFGPPLPGKVGEVDGEAGTFRFTDLRTKAEREFPLRLLAVDTLRDAIAAGQPGKKLDPSAAALAMIARKAPHAAATFLGEAEAAGNKAAGELAAWRNAPPGAAAAAEAELRVLEGQHQLPLLAAKRFTSLPDMEAWLAPLATEKLRTTSYVKAHRDVVVDLLTAYRAEALLQEPLEERFQAAEVDKQRGGKYRFTYDCATDVQSKDFKITNGKLTRVGQSWLLEGGANWIADTIGDVTVELVVTSGPKTRNLSLVLYHQGGLTGWLCGIRTDGPDHPFRISDKAPDRQGAPFVLPAHVVARLDTDLDTSDFYWFAKGPKLPASPTRITAKVSRDRLTFGFGKTKSPTFKIPKADQKGAIRLTTGDKKVQLAGLRITAIIDPAWLQKDAETRARAEILAAFK